MDEHRIGDALDPAILAQGVHWLTLAQPGTVDGIACPSVRGEAPGQKGDHGLSLQVKAHICERDLRPTCKS
jgi:hypothetical protein